MRAPDPAAMREIAVTLPAGAPRAAWEKPLAEAVWALRPDERVRMSLGLGAETFQVADIWYAESDRYAVRPAGGERYGAGQVALQIDAALRLAEDAERRLALERGADGSFVLVHGPAGRGVEFGAVLATADYLREAAAGGVREPHYLAGPFLTRERAERVNAIHQSGWGIEAFGPGDLAEILAGRRERPAFDYARPWNDIRRMDDEIAERHLAERALGD